MEIFEPLRVPDIVEVETVLDEVRVAEYEPSWLSVTELRVPAEAVNKTVSPPEDKLKSFKSFNCTVMLDMDVPLAKIEVGSAVIVDLDGDALLEADKPETYKFNASSKPFVAAFPETVEPSL